MSGAAGRYTSEGRRMLLVLLQRMSATALARKCGTDRRTISALATGVHARPSMRVGLELDDLGIACRAWKVVERSFATAVDNRSAIVRKRHDDAA